MVRRLYQERLEKKVFRMSIILQVIDLEPAERSRKIEELCAREWDIPFSKKRTLTQSTIYKWLREYRMASDPFEVLVDKVRSDRRAGPLILDKLC